MKPPGRARAVRCPTLAWILVPWSLWIAAPLLGCDRGPVEKSSTPEERVSQASPNVLLIVADALRADRIGAKRGDKDVMPFLTAYAKTSWSFSRAYVQATWTKPSMASIFTSLYPEVHQVLFGVHALLYEGQPPEADVLPSSLETMASYLRRNGYHTAAVQTNQNIGPPFGFGQGFDTLLFEPYPGCRATQVTDRALRILAEARTPFFLYLHYMDTHAPYVPPAAHREALGRPPEIGDEDRRLLRDYNSAYLDRVLNEVGLTPARRFADLSSEGQAYVRHMYDAQARYLDAEIARLIASIEQKAPHTVVVFTSDHGEELWDHGSVGHGKTVFEELIHVPLIIRMPGAPGRRIDAAAESIDILPTLAGLLGRPPSPDWQGRDLSEAHGSAPERPVVSGTKMSIRGSNVDLECAISGPRKLVVDSRRGTQRLFDLAKDQGEGGLASVDPEAIAPLLSALEEHHGKNRAHRLFGTVPERVTLRAEVLDNIRALGYVK